MLSKTKKEYRVHKVKGFRSMEGNICTIKYDVHKLEGRKQKHDLTKRRPKTSHIDRSLKKNCLPEYGRKRPSTHNGVISYTNRNNRTRI